MKGRDFLPKILPQNQLYIYSVLCDVWAVLVMHRQAQKYLQINHKPFHLGDINFNLTEFSTDWLTD